MTIDTNLRRVFLSASDTVGEGGHKILLGSLRRRRVINYFGDALMHALDAAATFYGLFVSVLVYESSLTFNRFVIKFWYLKEL